MAYLVSAVTTDYARYDVHDSEIQRKAKIISNYLHYLCILYKLCKNSNVFFESYWNCKQCNEWKMLIAKKVSNILEIQLHINFIYSFEKYIPH